MEEPSENDKILFGCVLADFLWSLYGIIKEPIEYIKPEFYIEKKIIKEDTLIEKENVLKNQQSQKQNRNHKRNCNLVQQIRKNSQEKIKVQSLNQKTKSYIKPNINSYYKDETMFPTPCNELASFSAEQCKYIRENPLSWCIEKKGTKKCRRVYFN